MNRLGNDFLKEKYLNLLPFIQLPPGYLRTEISYVNHNTKNTIINHSSFNHGPSREDLDCIVGQDVFMVEVMTHRHNSFPGNPQVFYKYTMRVDRLILLNLASKLLGYPK